MRLLSGVAPLAPLAYRFLGITALMLSVYHMQHVHEHGTMLQTETREDLRRLHLPSHQHGQAQKARERRDAPVPTAAMAAQVPAEKPHAVSQERDKSSLDSGPNAAAPTAAVLAGAPPDDSANGTLLSAADPRQGDVATPVVAAPQAVDLEEPRAAGAEISPHQPFASVSGAAPMDQRQKGSEEEAMQSRIADDRGTADVDDAVAAGPGGSAEAKSQRHHTTHQKSALKNGGHVGGGSTSSRQRQRQRQSSASHESEAASSRRHQAQGGANPNKRRTIDGNQQGTNPRTKAVPRHHSAAAPSGEGSGAGLVSPAAVVQQVVPSGPPSGQFSGDFVMTSGLELGSKLMFPRKKLRDQLTHYKIGAVTPELVTLLPATDPFRERGRKGSCAVIGNGGSLLLYSLGQAIDAHDVVIRLNSGPTKGFESFVGTHTGARIVNRAHMGYRETAEEPVLQHVSTDDALKQFLSVRTEAPGDATYMISMDFHDHAYEYTDKGALSNGFYAILLASELCVRVTVYGFLRQWKGSVRYHFYNQVGGVPLDHPYSLSATRVEWVPVLPQPQPGLPVWLYNERGLPNTQLLRPWPTQEEPDILQSQRDNKEELRIRQFMEERATTHRHGEPCMSVACESDGLVSCRGCLTGTTCSCGVWHPVPLSGFCYGPRHPLGRGVPDIGCVAKCRDAEECPGGLGGICPQAILENTYDVATGRRCSENQTII